MLRFKPRSSFVRNTLKLAGGSSIAQILAICALPLISRLYTPDSFEVFAVFASLLAILAISSSLSFDIAIPIAEDDKSAVDLFVLSIVSVVSFSSILSLSIYLIGFDKIRYLIPSSTNSTLVLLPFATFGIGIFNCLSQWSVRRKRFGMISVARIYQSVVGLLVQILFGVFYPVPIGLCAGRTLNASAGVISLIKPVLKFDLNEFSLVSRKSLLNTLRRFRDYPIFVTIENVLNISGTYIPILIISSFSSSSDGAFLLLAIQVSFLPVNLIGRAVGQVFTSEIPQAQKESRLLRLVYRTIFGLAKLGLGPAILVAIVAPEAIGFILGEDWARVGTLVSMAMPWCFFVFISSPISTIVYAAGRQRDFAILLGIASSIKICILFLLGVAEVQYLSEVFMTLSAVQFAIYLTAYLHFARLHEYKIAALS